MKLLAFLLAIAVATATTGAYTFATVADKGAVLNSLAVTNSTATLYNGTYVVTSHATIASILDTAQNQVLCLNSGTSNYTITTAAAITDGFMLSLTCSSGPCTAPAGAVFTITDVVNVTYTSDTSLTTVTVGTAVASTSTVTVAAGAHTAAFTVAAGVTTDLPAASKKYAVCWPNINVVPGTLDLAPAATVTVAGRTNHTMGNAFTMFSGLIATSVALFYGLF